MTFNKILVPVDFSEFSNNALQYALFLAERFHSQVTLLHIILLYHEDVSDEAHLMALENIVEGQEERKSKLMEKHIEESKSRSITVDSKLIRGLNAANTILEFIEENDFDLVVLGTHGRSGFNKWLFGSVAEKVMRLSRIPVLTIHKDFNKMGVERILVPIDFSETSKIGVDWGIVGAQEFKAELHFLHSVQVELHPEYFLMNSEMILQGNPAVIRHLDENLVKFTGIPKSKAVYALREGKAYKEIKRYAEDNEIDLIVMTAHGMGKLEHFLIGSTVERVARIASCPVLTVGRNQRGGN